MEKTMNNEIIGITATDKSNIETLSIDIETFSDEKLGDVGVHKYASSPSFKLLLFGYSINGGPVSVVDVARGEKIPPEVIEAIKSPHVLKWAHNAQFERVCLSKYLHSIGELDKGTPFLPANSWRCTMVLAAYFGLPLKLENLGAVLKIGKQKLAVGTGLIETFCVPCDPTEKNDFRKRNLPEHNPKGWNTFKDYNKRDVEAEMEVKSKMPELKNYPDLWKEYAMDQAINDRGIGTDMLFVRLAQRRCEAFRKEAEATFGELTGITKNVTSSIRMKAWLLSKGIEAENLRKETVEDLIDFIDETLPGNNAEVKQVKEALRIYRQLSSTSLKKYDKLADEVCDDGRVRGLFQFYGAHTGRWASKRFQPQNLPKSNMTPEELREARNTLLTKDYAALKNLSDEKHSVPDILAGLIRTALIPSNGRKFIVADYAQIEARVLAKLAGADWKLAAFKAGKDIYSLAAEKMFHKPVVKNGINGELRAKGKLSELSLGYGGGSDALRNMGGPEIKNKTDDELKSGYVTPWRDANPEIVQFWYSIGDAALEAVRKPGKEVVVRGFKLSCHDGFLFIHLPSGRELTYLNPYIAKDKANDKAKDKDGWENLFYTDYARATSVSEDSDDETDGDGENKKNSLTVRGQIKKTYGGKLTENITQAVARDLLCYAMQNLTDAGYEIVMHVHDEIIIDAPQNASVQEVCDIMAKTPDWAADLPLRAEGFEDVYYRKS